MRNRGIMVVLALLSAVIWASLVLFMNRQPPTEANQLIFLVIWTGAVLCSVMPLSYALNARHAASLGRVGDMKRALRQGVLAAFVAALLMALHLLQMLPPGRALVLVMIVVLVEALSYVRRREPILDKEEGRS